MVRVGLIGRVRGSWSICEIFVVSKVVLIIRQLRQGYTYDRSAGGKIVHSILVTATSQSAKDAGRRQERLVIVRHIGKNSTCGSEMVQRLISVITQVVLGRRAGDIVNLGLFKTVRCLGKEGGAQKRGARARSEGGLDLVFCAVSWMDCQQSIVLPEQIILEFKCLTSRTRQGRDIGDVHRQGERPHGLASRARRKERRETAASWWRARCSRGNLRCEVNIKIGRAIVLDAYRLSQEARPGKNSCWRSGPKWERR